MGTKKNESFVFSDFLKNMPVEFIHSEYSFNATMAETSFEIMKLRKYLLKIKEDREKELLSELKELQSEIKKQKERIIYRESLIDECMMRKAHCEIILNERKS